METKQEVPRLEAWTPETTLSNFRNLVACPAWAALVELVNAQNHGRERNVLGSPLKSSEAIYEQEFQKGEIVGALNAMALPELLMETAQAEIERKEQGESNV